MDKCHFSLGEILSFDNKIPVPEQLKGKDIRADNCARVAVISATNLIQTIDDLNLAGLNIIVVNREGCVAHINKVGNNIAKQVPAQGFFVRGGPQTLATYSALAIGAHGAALTLVGDHKTLEIALSYAIFIAGITADSATLLTVVGKYAGDSYQVRSVLIRSVEDDQVDANGEQQIYSDLVQVLNQEQVDDY